MKNYFYGLLVFITLFCGCTNVTNEKDNSFDDIEWAKLTSGEWTKSDGYMIYYLNEKSSVGASNSFHNNIPEKGTIKVLINHKSGTSDYWEYGISYVTNWDRYTPFFDFLIRQNGSYCIKWFDSNEDEYKYEDLPSTGWIFSNYLYTGLNVSNELRIDYDNNKKKYMFFINSHQVFEKIFNYIDITEQSSINNTVRISNYDDIIIDKDNKYRTEFKIISPYTWP
jgi:hypothetical protein